MNCSAWCSNPPQPSLSFTALQYKNFPEAPPPPFCTINHLGNRFLASVRRSGSHPDHHGTFAPFLSLAGFLALRLARLPTFGSALSALNARETLRLITGALLFCACFVAGTSLAASAKIVLLFSLSGLTVFSGNTEFGRGVRWAAPITNCPPMWSVLPSRMMNTMIGEIRRAPS